MNKKIRYTVVFICLLAFCSVPVSSQSVYEWVGANKNWHSVQNWSVKGSTPTTLPGKNDQVWINADHKISIEIKDQIEINSITIQGPVELYSKKKSDFWVLGSIFLSEDIELSERIQIEALGINQDAYLSIPANLSEHINKSENARYHEINNAKSASGSCPFFTIVSDPTPPTCNGFSDGIAAVLEPTDGVGPFTYQWVGGPAAQQWNNRSAGTYTVIVIDLGQGGLPCNLDVFVNEPGPLTVFSMNATAPLCADVCNGTATPIVIGGNGGYSYDWSSGETGISASMLCPTFTLEVTDQLGCVFDTVYNFPNVPDTIQFQAVISNVTCFGDDDGSINMSVTGGVTPFTYAWSGPNGFSSNSIDISSLEPGDYTLQVEDDNGCLADSTFTIEENPVLLADLAVTDNICSEGNAGAIDLTVTGGLQPYITSWSGPNGFTSSDEDISNLVSGIYEVSIEDAGGCILTLQAEIFEPSEIDIDLNSTDILCFGDFNGTASASASGGTAPYSYDWTGPNGFNGTGPGINGLEVGIYVVTVTDANLCEGTDSVEVFGKDELLLTLTETPVTCSDGSDGAIDLDIDGGTPGYDITWTGPNGFSSTDVDIANLEPGLYEVTVVDQNACTTTESLDLTNPAELQVNASITDVSCDNGSDGSIEITLSGGTPTFSFDWNGPNGFTSSDQDIFNLQAGSYSVEVTDINGCEINSSFTVGESNPIVADFVLTDAICFGDATGSIQATPGGGTPSYSASWIGPNGFTSSDFNIANLLAGDYTLEITDGNSCVESFNVSIGESPEILIDGSILDASCFNFSDGSIDLSVSGGAGGFTFSWSGPNGFTSVQEDLINLSAGTYTVTVTDANSCEQTADFDVSQPDELLVNGSISDVLCAGDSNGSIDIAVSGGVPPYTFAWTGPNGFSSSDEDISGLEAGTYTIEVTDSQLCITGSTFEVSETFVLTATPSITNLSCFGANDGRIEINIQGGLEPYTISWTGPNGYLANGELIENLEAGTYNLIASDDNGCSIGQSFEVISPDELIVSIDAENLTCTDANDGSATALPSGGTPTYEVTWSGPNGFSSTDLTISDLEAGIYTALVTDSENCTAQNSVEILNPLPIVIDVVVIQPSCTEDNGSLEAIPTGGTVATDYNYSWLDENGVEISTSSIITDLAPGTYTIIANDDNGCSSQQELELTRQSIVLNATITDAACLGINNGSIDLSPSGGTPDYNFSWSGPNGFSSTDQNISGLEPGDYTVNVNDSQGCIAEETYTVNEPNGIQITSTIVNESCPGTGDGSASISISGGTPGYSTSWTGPNGFNANGVSIASLSPGIYTAAVTDINGCQASEEIEIGIDSDYSIEITSIDPLCFEEATGSIDLEIDDSAGGIAPYNYNWTGPNGFSSTDQDISNLEAGEYVVVVSDGNNCEQTDTIELFNPSPLELTTNVTNSNCGQSDGSASAVVNGGTGIISYVWTDLDGNELSTESTLSAIEAGVYNLLVTDENGCTETAAITVTNVNGSVAGDITDPTCNGGSDGLITVNVINGTAPFIYEWTDGTTIISTNDSLLNASAGSYTLSVEDANGCVYVESFEISDPAPILGNPVITGVSCAGDDGAISLAITGGTEPYSINWIGPNGFTAVGNDINDLEQGDYTFVIIDANDCLGSETLSLELIPDLSADAIVTNVVCGGESTGAIDLTISNGVPPYQVEWSDSEGVISSEEDLNGIPAGEYTAVILDDAGCELTQTYTVDENTAINFDFTITQPDCGVANGSIMVLISGGVVSDNYFYTWTDQDGNSLPTQALLINLDVGLYTLFVSDDLGCSKDTTIALSNPDGQIDITSGNLSCNGAADGFIDLDITDVETPYAVGWTGPNGFTSIDEDISNLEPGTYTYFITGNDACSYSGQVEITSPDALMVESEILNTCFGENSGSISISISGGIPDYAVSWSGPNGFNSSEFELSDLEGGTYSLVVTDQNSCTYNEDFEIIENAELSVNASTGNIDCFGDASGEIQITISGGEAPFSINWTGPNSFSSDLELITGLEAGTYELLVQDGANCSFQAEYELTEPDSLEVIENIISAGCLSPGSLGEIELLVGGGVEPYIVSWSGPDGFTSNELSISDLEAGAYSYTLSDDNSCEVINTLTIETVDPIQIDITSQNISCNGETDGSISASISGGMGPYELDWTGPDGFASTLSELSGLSAGEYILNVTDDAGCSAATDADILEPAPLEINISDLVNATCNTSEDGSILVDVSGGNEPYEYNWTGPDGFASEDESLVFIAPGTYNLNVNDSRECFANESFNVDFNFVFNADAGPDQEICFSDQPLTLTGSINGDLGNDPSYEWSLLSGDLLSTDSILNINEESGTYVFVFRAFSGACSDSDTLTLEILEGPDVDAGQDQEVFAEENFTLGGNPTSASGVAFAWSPNPTLSFDTTLANPSGFLLETTEFVVLVTDASGCINSDTVLVEVLPEVSVSSGFTPNGDGLNDFWIIDNMELFPNNVVQIFNRWGQVLYEANSYNMSTAWDGKYENKDVPVGTYYYTIELNDPRFPDPITGPLTINR